MSCGTYPGEALVDSSGNYLGGFSAGMGIDAPLGFTRSQGVAAGQYDGSAWCGGVFGFNSQFWEAAYLLDTCYSLATNPSLAGPQPQVPVGGAFRGSLNGQIVTDSSGPTGMDTDNACEIDGTGNAAGFLTFIGDTASGHAGFTAGDYTSFPWQPNVGEAWIYRGWVKSVPDDNGLVADDYTIAVLYAWGNAQTFAGIHPNIPAGVWTEFVIPFTIPSSAVFVSGAPRVPAVAPTSYPVVQETRTVNDLSGHATSLTKFARSYRFHFKCLHLYPAVPPPSGGVHLWKRF